MLTIRNWLYNACYSEYTENVPLSCLLGAIINDYVSNQDYFL